MALSNIQKNMLSEIAGLEAIPEGAFSLRLDGQSAIRQSTENIEIVPKTDKPGIDIYIKAGTKGERVMNPTTVIDMAADSYMEMETAQIKGIDSTKRMTKATLGDNATLIIHEKIMTHGKQYAITEFEIDLNGEGCGTHAVSRSVAKDDSHQEFISSINGNNRCSGHTECDAIIMDHGSVVAVPKVIANHTDASLIHEAAIGKIAGEQLIKLMTLGLTEQEAEEQIVNGFLR